MMTITSRGTLVCHCVTVVIMWRAQDFADMSRQAWFWHMVRYSHYSNTNMNHMKLRTAF